MDVSRSTVLSIDSDMPVRPIISVFAYRRNGNPIFAISTFYTNSPIDAISAVFTLTTYGNRIRFQVLIQTDNQISTCIHCRLNIGSIIFCICFRAISFDGHGTVQFFGYRTCISSKLQSIIERSDLMGNVCIIFVNNPGHPISTIQAILALCRFHGKSVFAVFTIHTDRAILAIDYDG